MYEENGGKGDKAYADMSKSRNEYHIAAIKSDRGEFVPRGFTSNRKCKAKTATYKMENSL